MRNNSIISLSMAAAFAITGCGGGATPADPQADAHGTVQNEALKKPAAVGSQITVVARASFAANVGPIMDVLVDDVLIGRLEIRKLEYEPYSFFTPGRLREGAKVDVVFRNDAVIAGADRNLYVQTIAVDGKKLRSNAAEVKYDRGEVDGVDVVNGREDMLWNGALRLVHTRANQGLVVRARGSLVGGQGPLMSILVNGQEIAARTVSNAAYDDYFFNLPDVLPANSTLAVVFSNDLTSGAEDRNLYVESITANGTTQSPTSAGVRYDRGAVDGVDITGGQSDMLWNGGLLFNLSAAPPPPPPTVTVRPGDTPPAGYTLCAVENGTCNVGATTDVIYGAGSDWTPPRSVDAGLACSNGTFPDIAPGRVKACYTAAPGSITPPPTDTDPKPPAQWGTPKNTARVFISGHSLTDNPLGDHLVRIANSLGDSQSGKYNQQIEIGSPIRYRTDVNSGWAGYSRGKNRDGYGMNVINELRNPATLGGDRYDTLVIAENHNLLEMLQWEDTVRNLRHYHERFLNGNAQGQTYLYEAWKDIFDKSDPRAWIAYERGASSAWQCVAARVNRSLSAAGRADRIKPLPAGAALAALVERATTGGGLAGISGGGTTETVNRIFSDAVHLTDLGAYYISLVTYASVYQRSPVGAVAPAGISATQARSLQETAWSYVSGFYGSYQPSDLASCAPAVAATFCATYWNYRGSGGNIAGCTAHFSRQDTGNPLYYSAQGDASYWYAPPP